VQGINELPKRIDHLGRHRPQQRSDRAECQQNPQEPRRPWTDRQHVPPEMEEVEISHPWGVIAQKARIIGDRHRYEDRNQERRA
jgi:hypothetical protein